MIQHLKHMCGIVVIVVTTLAGVNCAFSQQSSPVPSTADTPDIAELMQSGTNLPRLLDDPEIVDALMRGEKPEHLTREQLRLQDLLAGLGYLDAKLTFDIPAVSGDQPARIVARVESGRRYTIGSVQIDPAGVSDSAMLTALDNVVVFAAGKVAEKPLLDQISERALWQVGEAGYPFAIIEPLIMSPGQEPGQIDILVSIQPGDPARFGGINVDRVPAGLIERVQALQPFQPGELYSSRQFDHFRAALDAMPGIRRAQAEIVGLPGGQFELNISVRADAVTGFNDSNTALGISVLMATLLAIMLGLLFRRTPSAQPRFGSYAFRAVILCLAFGSITLVFGRAASLV